MNYLKLSHILKVRWFVKCNDKFKIHDMATTIPFWITQMLQRIEGLKRSFKHLAIFHKFDHDPLLYQKIFNLVAPELLQAVCL